MLSIAWIEARPAINCTARWPAVNRVGSSTVIVPFILGGAMGPVTNAGAIAQSLAETMAGCALTQLERPGAPVIFGNFLSSMSLRSGSPTFGTPEPAIGSMVVGQLARRLNLPLRCSGNFTTSKLPDAQARHDRLCELNALEQVINVSHTTILRDAWARGQDITVHAWVYSLRNGLVTDLGLHVDGRTDLPAAYAHALDHIEATERTA